MLIIDKRILTIYSYWKIFSDSKYWNETLTTAIEEIKINPFKKFEKESKINALLNLKIEFKELL